MPQQKDTTDLVDEEITFWRGFIDWWETKEDKPATQRMGDALGYAEAKRSLLLALSEGDGD